MEPVLLFFGVFALFGGFIVLGVWAGFRQLRQARTQLEQLAARLGLTVVPQPKVLGFETLPELHGQRRGKAVRVFRYATGSGKSRTQWAAVEARPPQPGSLTFRFSGDGFGAKLLTLFGAKEIQVGDDAFDRRWFIQTNAPDFLRAALLPEVRARLMAVATAGGRGAFETVDGAVRYAEIGGFNDQARLARFAEAIEAVCDLADIVEVEARHRGSGG